MASQLTKTAIFSILTAAAALLPIAAAQAGTVDQTGSGYYTITSIQTREIPTTQAQRANPASTAATTQPNLYSTPLGGIDISDIVNIGKQVWDIIEANKPVANVTMSNATVVPQGITNWQDLSGWQAPQTKTYETTFTNGFGMTVIDFQYTISYVPGGNYDGSGQYLANVTVVPENVTVDWGYTFNAKATVPSITNAGTREEPIAAAEVLVQWTVDTVVTHDEQSAQYYVRGDGQFEAMQ